MKTYNVEFYVTSSIKVDVEANNKKEALQKAIDKGIEEEPLVSWLVDEDQEANIREEE